MRDFFINGLEWVIHAVVLAAAAGVAILAIGIALGGVGPWGPLPRLEGIVPALAALGAGLLGVLVAGGALYLGFGVYANTRRTADALELLIAMRQR